MENVTLVWDDCMKYLVFVSDGAVMTEGEVGFGYWTQLWRPSMTRVIPPTLGPKFCAWWLFHYSGVFRNRDYAVMLVGAGDKIIHRSCIVPAYFRWPFMKAKDCQISSMWTHPDYRGQGLATASLKSAMGRYAGSRIAASGTFVGQLTMHLSQCAGKLGSRLLDMQGGRGGWEVVYLGSWSSTRQSLRPSR